MERNRQLAAEVRDLKTGIAALEERARSDLGMIAGNETFYQVVPAKPAAAPTADRTSGRALSGTSAPQPRMRYWLVMPAAGAGRRFGTQLPKQYAPLLGRTVIEWALQPFIADPRCAGIVVALAPADPWWPQIAERLSSPGRDRHRRQAAQRIGAEWPAGAGCPGG